jgi:hypothetical protein
VLLDEPALAGLVGAVAVTDRLQAAIGGGHGTSSCRSGT